MSKLEIRGMEVASEVDEDGEVAVQDDCGRICCYLNSGDAQDLVDHLIAVFGLRDRKD